MTGRALITGASGFLGRHLSKALRRKGIATVALTRAGSRASETDECVAISDLTDTAALKALISQTRPDWIFHLAGRPVAASLAELYRVNVLYGTALLQAAGSVSSPPLVVVAGSAAEYGLAAGTLGLVDEDAPCRPTSAYGITKLAQTQHALMEPCPVIVARLFNPVGPGMAEHLALGSFASQIASMGPEGGILTTGPLDVERDFIEVSAAVEALIMLARSPPTAPTVVNVCSGVGTRLRDLLGGLLSASHKPVVIEERGDRGSGTSAGLVRFVGNPSRLASCGIVIGTPAPDKLGRELLSAFN